MCNRHRDKSTRSTWFCKVLLASLPTITVAPAGMQHCKVLVRERHRQAQPLHRRPGQHCPRGTVPGRTQAASPENNSGACAREKIGSALGPQFCGSVTTARKASSASWASVLTRITRPTELVFAAGSAKHMARHAFREAPLLWTPQRQLLRSESLTVTPQQKPLSAFWRTHILQKLPPAPCATALPGACLQGALPPGEADSLFRARFWTSANGFTQSLFPASAA